MEIFKQKCDHRRLIHEAIETQKRILVRQGIRAIRVRAIEVLLYLVKTVEFLCDDKKRSHQRWFNIMLHKHLPFGEKSMAEKKVLLTLS